MVTASWSRFRFKQKAEGSVEAEDWVATETDGAGGRDGVLPSEHADTSNTDVATTRSLLRFKHCGQEGITSPYADPSTRLVASAGQTGSVNEIGLPAAW